MGIFDTQKNQVYMVKVQHALQFSQTITSFQDALRAARDGHDEPLDNEAIKSMSYMDKKKQLVDAFGTSKSKKKVTSMITNLVDESGITNVHGKGVRDVRLVGKAEEIKG